jgi:hypoxanthine phosphoribosyltransferase
LGISVTILWSRCSDPRGFVLVFHLLRQYLLHSNFRIRSLGDLACINPTIITLPTMVEKVYLTYNDVHNLCKESAEKLLADIQPQLMIAIGGGGYVPARILRSFLKKPGSPNIPIQAIGLSLYEQLGGDDTQVEAPGTRVTRTQWLDLSSLGEMKNLIGKRILIVDEVDDTRTTLEYAVKELEKDVEAARQSLGGDQPKTKFSIFVLHNKNKQKKGVLPADMMSEGRYHAARTVGDEWICYPWEAVDIEEHDRLARDQKNKVAQ